MKTFTLRQAQTSRERDYLVIGSTPNDEICTQCGHDLPKQIMECEALVNQLRRIHGQEPAGCQFFILENHHDAGIYHEVAIFFTDQEEDEAGDDTSYNYATDVEELPDLWDDAALIELRDRGYFMPTKQAAPVIQITQQNLHTNKFGRL